MPSLRRSTTITMRSAFAQAVVMSSCGTLRRTCQPSEVIIRLTSTRACRDWLPSRPVLAGVQPAAQPQVRTIRQVPDCGRSCRRSAGYQGTRAKIGDAIGKVKRGAPLPAVEDVARRLRLSQDPGAPGVTFGQAWDAWLSGNKRLRASARRRLEGIGRHWLLPVLADVPLERLNGAHCAAVFDRIERINAEIAAQRAEGRALTRAEGDVRQRPVLVGVASQHRVFAALRTVLNFEGKVTHRLAFNPVYAVRLEPEETAEAQRWRAVQATRFLEASASEGSGCCSGS